MTKCIHCHEPLYELINSPIKNKEICVVCEIRVATLGQPRTPEQARADNEKIEALANVKKQHAIIK